MVFHSRESTLLVRVGALIVYIYSCTVLIRLCGGQYLHSLGIEKNHGNDENRLIADCTHSLV